jgi:hypothetical protein
MDVATPQPAPADATGGQCPWDGFETAATHFCEHELCAWIEQPANTWSNLAYVVIGVVVLLRAHRDRRMDLAAIGWIAIVLAGGSMFFHGSSTALGEMVDLSMMYLFSTFVIVLNVKRLLGSTARLWALAIAIFGATIVVLVAYLPAGIPLFVTHVIVAGALEIRIRRVARVEGARYGYLVLLVLFFAVAWTAWWLDILEIVCDPHDHVFQGHAFWHVSNSFCFLWAYEFYASQRVRL